MPCQKEDRDLIGHLLGAEDVAGLGVARGHDARREIVGRMSCRDLCGAGPHQFPDQRAKIAGGAGSARALPGRKCGMKRGQRQDGLGALECAEGLVGARGDVLGHRHGEERAEDHVCGRLAHQGFEVDLALGHRLRRGAGGGQHGGKAVAQPPAREGRVDQASLARVGLAFGHEDRLAEETGEPLRHAARFRELPGFALQHAGDQIGFEHEERAQARRAELGHLGGEQMIGLGREQIAPEGAQPAQPSPPPSARGPGRDHAMTEVKAEAATSIRLADGLRPRNRCASVFGPAVMRK